MLANVSKAYGGVFAVVQMVHLVSLALLGGAVLITDLRLLGLVLRDVPSEVVASNMDRWFTLALIIMAISGIFMSLSLIHI